MEERLGRFRAVAMIVTAAVSQSQLSDRGKAACVDFKLFDLLNFIPCRTVHQVLTVLRMAASRWLMVRRGNIYRH